MNGRIGSVAVGVFLLAGTSPAKSQGQPEQLTLAIYAPSAAFSDSASRLTYIQGLAKTIEKKTGVPSKGASYTNLGQLVAARPDFAILDGQCIAGRGLGSVLASASVGGEAFQSWGLFTRGERMAELSGKKLAVVEMGCRDDDFLDHAMLEGEKARRHFAALVKQMDVAGAVAAVRDYKKADAVFAPTGSVRGLTRVYDAGQVPNPGFVQLNKSISGEITGQVKEAVLGYGASGGIDGWKPAAEDLYRRLAGRMGARPKLPVFAPPEVVRFEDQDVLEPPKSTASDATVKQHFWEPQPQRPM